jgi:hypothetical protein
LAKDAIKNPRKFYQDYIRAWGASRGPGEPGTPGGWTRAKRPPDGGWTRAKRPPDTEGAHAATGMGFGGLRTKAEFKKKWHEAARKHHPDMGGTTEKMQEVNRAFEDFKNSPAYEKLAHLLARLNRAEREKLSSVRWPILARVLVK